MLVVAVVVLIQARSLLKSEGRRVYMDNIFPLYRYIEDFSLWFIQSAECRLTTFLHSKPLPLASLFYSLFGFIVLHVIMYSGNIYFWRRFRVNYPFIFGFKQGSELGYREVLLLSSGVAVLTLAGVISNLDMDMDPRTSSFRTITELVPVGLVTVT